MIQKEWFMGAIKKTKNTLKTLNIIFFVYKHSHFYLDS